MRRQAGLVLAALVALPLAVSAGPITKGPYLQSPGQASMTIMWECDAGPVNPAKALAADAQSTG